MPGSPGVVHRLLEDLAVIHVQLAVIDGNEAGRALYEGLGFKPFGKLRTILFT